MRAHVAEKSERVNPHNPAASGQEFNPGGGVSEQVIPGAPRVVIEITVRDGAGAYISRCGRLLAAEVRAARR